jgi:2-hydroxychromene-2-carboxylate isomerase
MAFTFWFELASPCTYPAVMRFEAEAQKRGVEALWRPFLLGPIFKAQGLAAPPFLLNPAKGRYAARDLERICADLSIPLHWAADARPQNSLLAARVATALPEADRPIFARALMALAFGEGADISEDYNVRRAVRAAGLKGDVVDFASDDSVRRVLRLYTDEAMALGIFGAPNFVTSDGELFWGNDRLEAALDWEVRLKEQKR